MERLKMQSHDVIGSNTQKIARLFPNCVTERLGKDGKPELAIDFEKLQAELSNEIIAEGEERYQFTWPDKRASVRLANTPTTMTLRPCREESVDFDNTQNLYIEGDNLDVLKVLRETYLGKVKMIYIDPPYNTGNDFVYNDDFSIGSEEFGIRNGFFDEEGNQTVDPMQRNTESNGRFHTDWLNMIYPRLKVARDLLSEDGVIFISIDDNEVENLRKVCDEIFGENNFISQISWRRTDNQPNIGFFARVKEHILLYSKSISFNLGRLPLSEKAKAEYRYSDAKGLFRRSILLHKTRGRKFYPKVTKLGNTLTGPWMVTEEEFDRMDANDEIYWTENGDGQPYGKIYLSESKGQIPNDFWGIEFGTNQRGSLEVEKLFNQRYFDFPKPVSLLSNIVMLGADKDSFILDFFSGSATTAHAVMKLNAEDGGNRKFIMVQLPEKTDEKSEAYKAGYKNICEIGKERIRRAGRKINEELGVRNEKLDIGFRVLKLDSSNMEDVYYTPKEFSMNSLFNENVKADRTNEDLLFQVMLDLGIELSVSIRNEELGIRNDITVFNVDDGYLMAVFDKDVDEKTITEIAKRKPVYFVMRDASASNDNVIDNFEQIFKHYSPETTCRVI
ncbi:MAG: site-specific DNA-methyltransferase [Paludibacteraceae bacterium]|nr:site-specific DNA-methyltransferase [Paludibacteraceae bacterium]